MSRKSQKWLKYFKEKWLKGLGQFQQVKQVFF
jgi:hypothetical protein